MVLLGLMDSDPRVRALALQFFYRVPDDTACAHLLSVLEGDRRLFAGIRDEVTSAPTLDRTLEETIWRVLGPLVAAPSRARNLARAEALAGRGGRALYDALARGDSAWLVSAAEQVARALPNRTEDLINSFAQFPRGVPIRPVRDRVRQAFADGARTAHPSQPVARARSIHEMHFAASLVPCPTCGTRIDAQQLHLAGNGEGWALTGDCPRCATRRGFTFLTYGDPLTAPTPRDELAGPRPSEIIAPAQWIAEIDRLIPLVRPDPTPLGVQEWAANRDANI